MSFPLIRSDKAGGRISEDENRTLAAFPQLSLHSGMQEEVENWIDDNAGGRDEVRAIYNRVNVNVLNTPRDDSNFYADDWVFTINEVIINYLQHADVMTREQQDQFYDSYKKIQDKMAQREIYMCSMVYPHKVQVYPEKFEKYVIPLVEETQLDVFQKMSEEHPDMNMNVLYDELESKKKEGQLVYSKAYDGSHWNNRGAFTGYQELMKEIQKGIPDIRILKEEDLDITEVQREKIYNERTYTESDTDYKVKNPGSTEDNAWFDSIGYQTDDMWRSYRHYINQNGELPKIVIVGDSYTWMFMMPWISESFSETVFIHQLDMGNLDMILDEVEPDVVVFAGLEDCVTKSITGIANEG